MQSNNFPVKRWNLVLLILFLAIKGNCQITNSLYFMNGIPQKFQINPAFQPECNIFIGLPMISPLQADAHSSRFALKDVVYYDEGMDSIITFLHPSGDKDAFLGQLGRKNFLMGEVSTSLGSIGFRAKKLYFTFDISDRFFTQVSLPDDLFQFALDPDSAKVYDFGQLQTDLTALTALSMGVSREFGEKLRLGIRGNIYLGWANLNTQKFDFNVSTGEEQWEVHSDIQLNSSWPYYLRDNIEDMVVFGVNGTYSEILEDFLDSAISETGILMDELGNDPYHGIRRISRSLFDTKNFGLGLDIGADYRVNEWLQVSASLIDIGRILWDHGNINMNHNTDYYFNGIDFSLGGDEDFLEAFRDSLENVFNQFIADENSYTTWLPSKIYIGAAFYVHPRISFGALSRTDLYKGNIRQQFTVSANFYPIRMLSANLTYSVMDGYFKNLGLGLAFNLFPFNLYVITDSGPSTAMWWDESRNINFRMGMNLVFGCPKRKGKTFDKPLID